MSAPAPTINRSVATTGASGAVALRGVADLLEGRELTPAMGRWVRRLAATFSSWHAAVVGALETHPALSLTDPTMGVEVADSYVESIVALTRGLGPREGDDGVVPVAVALVELAGSFEPTFATMRSANPALHFRLSLAAGLAPTPFGAATGLTSEFVAGVLATVGEISVPGLPATDVRRRLDAMDLEMIEAIGYLRRAGIEVAGTAGRGTNDAFEPARVAALASVLDADDGFRPGEAADAARYAGPLALAATGDFDAVARTDERVAAGLLVAERRAASGSAVEPVAR